MGRMKQLLLIIPVIAILVVCAFLPGITLGLMDRVNLNTSAAAPIQSIQLTPEENGELGPEYFFQKLLLQKNIYDTISLSPEAASLTDREALDTVIKQLQEYYYAELIPQLDFMDYSAKPFLQFGLDNTGSISWLVSLGSDGDSVLVLLDDATGKILQLSYHTSAHTSAKYPPDDCYSRVEALANIFFGQLGILPRYVILIQERELESGNRELESGAMVYDYTLAISEDAQLTVQFILCQDGFEITCG